MAIGKLKPTSVNAKCSMKFPETEFTLHTANTRSTIPQNALHQMKTTLMVSPFSGVLL
jgi:hypothetical protein